MRIASNPSKHLRAAAAGILLIVAVFGAGVADCDSARTYQLTISSASGGSVAIPGEGTFTYDEGTVVQLAATPDDGYQFLSWTGDIAHIGDPNTASTTITINGNCAVLANFEIEGETGPNRESPFPL